MPNPTAPFKSYRCHKVVSAFKIASVVTAAGGGALLIAEHDPADTDGPPFTMHGIQVAEEYCLKHAPMVGGWFVLYEDGYQSFSPAGAFEAGYTEVVPQ